jgi:hypothetical protein
VSVSDSTAVPVPLVVIILYSVPSYCKRDTELGQPPTAARKLLKINHLTPHADNARRVGFDGLKP